MRFKMQEGGSSDQIQFGIADIAFYSKCVDERSKAAVEYIKQKSRYAIEVSYDPETYQFQIGQDLVGVQKLAGYFKEPISSVALEATTLNIAEIYLLVRTFWPHTKISILYVEPDYYLKDKSDSSHKNKSFLLSVKTGYQAIPSAVVDLSRPEVKHGVFFLGFEGHRLSRLLEEHQHVAQKECTMVFGVPPFVPLWEMYSYIPNLPIIKEYNKFNRIEYCSANNPQSSLELLERISKLIDFDNNEKMFIAPIGTKPCGLAAAFFAVIHQQKIGLIYDHPQKSIDRTTKLGSWHVYEPV